MTDERILNKPDAVEWRNCSLSKEEETAAAKTFQKDFRKFDFNAM